MSKTGLFGPTGPLNLILADDHPIVLEGLVTFLEGQPDLQIMALCHSGEAAIRAVRRSRPDVLVLDLGMPGTGGLEVLSSIDAINTKVICLTAAGSPRQLAEAVARGARALIYKDEPLDELLSCIRHVAAGGERFPPEVAELIEAARGKPVRTSALGLSDRESQVMTLVAKGLSNRDVGKQLRLSEGTIKIHLHNIYGKVGVPNRTALAAFAFARPSGTHDMSQQLDTENDRDSAA